MKNSEAQPCCGYATVAEFRPLVFGSRTASCSRILLRRVQMVDVDAAADIAAMRTLKAAFDPTGYLNAAVLFD